MALFNTLCSHSLQGWQALLALRCCLHMLSVGPHSVAVDPKVSQMTCSFDCISVKRDWWRRFVCCSVVMIKSVPVFVLCLGCWKIRYYDTTEIHYPVVVALLLLPPWSPLMFCLWAPHLPVWVSCWAHFSSDLPGPCVIHCRGPTRSVIPVVSLLWADEEQSSSSQAA